MIQSLEFSGNPWTEKIEDLRQFLINSDRFGMVVSELDEIAWLFNMRGEGGSTVDSLIISPLFQSMALVTLDDIKLWVHQEKVDENIRQHLNPDYCNQTHMCVEIKDISRATIDLNEWATLQENVSNQTFKYNQIIVAKIICSWYEYIFI